MFHTVVIDFVYYYYDSKNISVTKNDNGPKAIVCMIKK